MIKYLKGVIVNLLLVRTRYKVRMCRALIIIIIIFIIIIVIKEFNGAF